MKLLLDTHALLWFIKGDSSLSIKARSAIENPNNDLYVSIVSFYEIAIKRKIGKLAFKKTLDVFWKDTLSQNIVILPITEKHLLQYDNIPLIADHKDPFDRLIIATASSENMPIITKDEKFSFYLDFVSLLW